MKMKKCLAIILALVMALGCMSFTAFAEEVDCEYCGGTGKETGDVAFLTYVRQKMDEIKNIDGASFDAAFGANKDSAVQSRINMLLDCVRDIPMKFATVYMLEYPAETFNDEYQLVDERVLELAEKFDMSAMHLDIYRDSYNYPDDFIMEWESRFSDIEGAYNALAEVVGNLPCRVCLGTGKVEAPEEPEDDPSGVDLSMLTTGAKIQLGTQEGDPVEWVIGGDGTDGMSVPEGCIALVTSDIVANNVAFDPNGTSNVYASSNLRTVVESAVTFSADEQAVIQERTLAGNQTYGNDCDGVAGDSVTATVWAPTTKDAVALALAGLSAVGSEYWLCSPGALDYRAATVVIEGGVAKNGSDVDDSYAVRAALYLDLSKVYGAEAVTGAENTYTLDLTAPTTFLTTFTLNKDYNDKYTADTKSTAVNETVSFTITPVTTGAPAFSETATTESPFTFTMTVTDGVGEAEVDLPDLTNVTSVGEYWYEIEETAGTTAGVDYDENTYYLHLIVSYKNGEFGFSSAAIRSSNEVTADENGEYPTDGKIDTVSNSYGEGTLTVAQETTVNGEDSDEDTFEVTVTFTAPAGTTVIGDITYGDDQTVTFNENGVGTAVINLKGGESVTFENIPDGVTYTVEQTGKNEDKGYTLDSVSFGDTGETGDDSVSDANVASGTIGDAADTVTITNSKTVPIDVGVILENGAFIVLALGALIAAAWLIVSKRRKSVDAE